MPTDDESKRRVSLLAKGLIGLAVLMVAAGTLYSRWAKQRDRDNALDDIAIGLDNTTLEFEHCITATTDPSAYGRGMFEQLRTRDVESDSSGSTSSCAATNSNPGSSTSATCPCSSMECFMHARIGQRSST